MNHRARRVVPLLLALSGLGAAPAEIAVPPIETPLRGLPGVGELPVRPELPDVLTLENGRRVATPAAWEERRAEMKRLLAYYAVGQAPPPPGNVSGKTVLTETVLDGAVRYRLVHLTFGPKKALSLDIGVFTPAAGGPFPAVIVPAGTPPGAMPLPRQPKGPNQGRGENVLLLVGPGDGAAAPPVIPGQEATGAPDRKTAAETLASRHAATLRRGWAVVVFENNDCAEDTTLRNADGSWAFRNTRFYPAYPGYDWGVLAGWAWGVSRIADYLETDRAIDAGKLVVTGASRSGKAAMIAAAFDERLVGAPVVTGGGGIGAYRFSGAGRGGREGLGEMMNKYPNWFSPRLHSFWGQTDRLPFDAHFFLALCAPRPFLALEGETDGVSLPSAVRATFQGARPAYERLGVPDRLGVHYAAHGHAFTEEDWTALLDFADHHLRGKKTTRRFDRFLGDGTAPVERRFDVRDFGAKGDGTTKDTIAFQKALDACAVSGGGDVVVPAGSYLIGSVQMGQRTTLRLEKDSVLLASPDLADYPIIDVRWEGRWQPGHRALIHAAFVDDIAIVGPGRIEGTRAIAFGDHKRGAVVLEAVGCRGLRWEGFSVTHDGTWATHPTFCDDVVIRGLHIRNTRDGIDIDSCRRVRIEDCDIDTGDDAISLKSGRGMDGARLGRATEDVVIRGCTLGGGRFACIGIGSETSGGIRNVRIERTRFTHSRTHAIYIKTRTGRAGVIENISGEDLDVADGGFLRINLTRGGNQSTPDDTVEGEAGWPRARNFRFSNVRMTNVTTFVQATEVAAENPLLGLSLTRITGTCQRGISLVHVREAELRDIDVTGYSGPLLATDDVKGIGLEAAVPYVAGP